MKKIFTLTILGFLLGLNCFGQTPPDPKYPLFRYNTPDSKFTVNTPIPALYPVSMSNMSASTIFSISPALPDGLFLETNTGVIHGSPTGISSANYTITATDPSSKLSNNCSIKITVLAFKPGISYTTYNTFVTGVTINSVPANLTTGQPAPPRPVTSKLLGRVFKAYHDEDVYQRLGIPIPRLRPTFGPGSSKPVGYNITPALPAGLNFNIVTGEITGTPTTITAPAKYTVTAYYTSDPANTFDLYISVVTNPDMDTSDASIEFVGEGDIQQSINTGAKIAANTGLGVIYRENSNRHYGPLHNIELDFSINVASTVDTIKSNLNNGKVTNTSAFGNSVLLPLNSGQAFSFSLIGYLTKKGGKDGNYYRNEAPKPLLGILSGFKFDIAGSNRHWELDTIAPTPKGDGRYILKTSVLSTYAGFFYEFITPTAKNNYGQNASATLGFGLTGRWLLGDAAQGSNPQQFLGTTTKMTTFVGPEIQLGLRFYNIKAAVHIPILPGKSNNNIAGLTGAQPTTFIGFSGGFPIDLTKKPASTP